MGSIRSAMSAVVIMSGRRCDASCAAGALRATEAAVGVHCCAPDGLLTSSHSYSKRFFRYSWSQRAGSLVHEPSRPLPVVSSPLPLPWRLCQPRPICWIGAASGSGPTRATSPAPWLLPKVWPPAVSATVS